MTKLPKTQPTLPFEGYIKSIHPQRGGAIGIVPLTALLICLTCEAMWRARLSPHPFHEHSRPRVCFCVISPKDHNVWRIWSAFIVVVLSTFPTVDAVLSSGISSYLVDLFIPSCYPEAQRKINSVSYCSECFGELDAKKSRDERRYIHEHLGSIAMFVFFLLNIGERILAWNPRPDLLFLSQLTLYRDVDACMSFLHPLICLFSSLARTTGQDDVSLNYYPPFQYIYPQMKLNSDNTPLHSPCFQLAFFHTNELALRSTQGRCHRLADIPLVLPRTKGTSSTVQSRLNC